MSTLQGISEGKQGVTSEDVGVAADAEEWCAVTNYEGRYEVSDLGRVRSLVGGKSHVMSGVPDSTGYPTVRLSNGYGNSKRFKVHRLVCRAFHGPQPWGHEVAHLDGSKTNAAASNLRWLTPRENHAHKAAHGTRQTGERNGRCKFSDATVAKVRALARGRYSESRIVTATGVSKAHVHRIIAGEARHD